MKRLLLATSAFLLILPDIGAAYAQVGPKLPPGATTKPGRPGGPQIQPPRPQPPNPRPPRPRPPGPGNGGGVVRPPRPPRPPVTKPMPPLPRPPKPGKPHRPGAGRPPNFRPIHRPGWVYPPGWHYRRWTIGLLLPAIFVGHHYYYDDWWQMGLEPPPPGYRWVRYDRDLLLVNVRTRRVADVIYDAFY